MSNPQKIITFGWWNPMKNHHYTQSRQDFCPSPRGLPRGLPRKSRGPTSSPNSSRSSLAEGRIMGSGAVIRTWDDGWGKIQQQKLGTMKIWTRKKIWKLEQDIYLVVSWSQTGWFIVPNMYFPWVYGNEINIVQWGNHLVQWWWWWSMGIIVRLSLLMIIV